MTMREKIRASIAHRNVDFVPINVETTAGFEKNLAAVVGEKNVDAALGNHMLRKKYKRNKKLENGDELDLFGVTWQTSKDGGDVGIVKTYPLEHCEVEDYAFPAVCEDLAEQTLAALEAEKERYTMFSITMGFFERAWSLCGMENLLCDMILEPEKAERVFDGIYEHHDKLLDIILKRDFDAVYFGDDWGQQNGLIMGPEMWRKFIKPKVGKLFSKIKAAGKQIVLHSCGDLREILGEVIDMGVDVYNTVQPEIYSLKDLKKEYGKDLTFYGGISTQQFLPFADVKEVREKTKEVLDVMMRGGGYILSPTHAVTPDIPVENVLALVETGREYFK